MFRHIITTSFFSYFILMGSLFAQSILEAEDAFFSSGMVDTKHAGYTGTGFVDTENAAGESIEWFLNVDSVSTDSLGFRYALGKVEIRSMEVYLNEVLLDTIDFDDTGLFTTWLYKSIAVQLDSGINRVKLVSVNPEGAPNMDHLRILSDTSQLPYFQLSVVSSGNGTVTSSVSGDSAQAGSRITLTATADPGYSFAGWSGDISESGNPYSFLLDQSYAIQADFANSLPAFPGADGFGKNTTGGRGGAVIEVTNLNDNGAGSLRSAINTPGARTIVFRVSGTIFLNSKLTINQGDLTIAGQTAPGDGICIANYPLTINANNVIIRYIRCRLGDQAQTEDDAFGARFVENIIVDHCSFSWGVDEVASTYINTNFTMQWCIISESLFRSIHEKGDHGYGGIWGGDHASFHHNLIAHHTSRNPRFNGNRFVTNATELTDHRNNVIYNWGFNSAYGGEPSDLDGIPASINVVNNYYRFGPATNNGSMKFRIVEPSQNSFGFSSWYVDGNEAYGYPAVLDDNWTYGVQDVSAAQKAQIRVNQPFDFEMDTTHTARVAFEHVLANSGTVLPNRDAVDARIIEEVCTGTATYGGVYSSAPEGIIDTQGDVGGWPTLASTTPPLDTDKDGMPDDWEQARGLNINDASDRNGDDNSDGYTNLEEYLNELVEAFAYVVRPIEVEAEVVAGKDVELSWTDIAENETNFVIERDIDGAGYLPLATVPANTVSYTDLNTGAGFYSYRLRTIGAVDTSCYTEPVTLELATGIEQDLHPFVQTEIFPSPFSEGFFVTFELNSAETVSVTMVDTRGRTIYSGQEQRLTPGAHRLSIQPGELSPGVYFVKILSSQGQLARRIVKQN